METIKISDILAYCEKAADVSAECLEKAFQMERNGSQDMAAIAFFMERESLYRYEIPGIIQSIAKHMENDAKQTPPYPGVLNQKD